MSALDLEAEASARPWWEAFQAVRERERFFHWELEFPEVFAAGGFDCVLGNPPWERLLADRREFYGRADVLIRAYSGGELDARIRELQRTHPMLAREFDAYSERVKTLTACLGGGGDYRFAEWGPGGRGSAGTQDLFKFFVERAYQVLRSGGRLGYLLPSSIYNAEGCTGLRHLLLDEMRIQRFYGFENRHKIFEIDSRYKFVCLVAEKVSERNAENEFQAAFMRHELAELESGPPAGVQVLIRKSEIEQLSPGSFAFLEYRTAKDRELVLRMYGLMPGASPRPHLDARIAGAWNARAYREFHTTDDRELWTRDDGRLWTPREICGTDWPADRTIPFEDVRAEMAEAGFWPVYEGKQIDQFLVDVKPVERWVSLEAVKKKYGKLPNPNPRIVFRDIARNTDERTCIAAVLPDKSCCCHTLTTFEAEGLDLGVAVAVLNSFAFDFLVRLRTAGTHLSWTFLSRVAAPIRAAQPVLLVRVLVWSITAYLGRQRRVDQPPLGECFFQALFQFGFEHPARLLVAPLVELRVRRRIVAVEPAPEQRITAADVVREEAQGAIACKRLNPQCYLGELHRGRVQVHTKETLLDDATLAPGRAFCIPAITYFDGKRPIRMECRRRIAAALAFVRVEQPRAQIARGADKVVARPAGEINDPQRFNLPSGLSRHERRERFAYFVLHDLGNGVERSARLARRARLEKERPALEPAQKLQRRAAFHTLVFFLGLDLIFRFIASGFDVLIFIHIWCRIRMEPRSLRIGDDGNIPSHLEQFLFDQANQLLRREHQVPASDAAFDKDTGGFLGLVFKQALVNRAKLLDFEFPERHPLAPDAAPRPGRAKRQKYCCSVPVIQPKTAKQPPLRRILAEQPPATRRNVLQLRQIRRDALVEDAEQGADMHPQSVPVRGERCGSRPEQTRDNPVERVAALVQSMADQSLVARLRIQNEEQPVKREEPGVAECRKARRWQERLAPSPDIFEEPADDTLGCLKYRGLEVVGYLGAVLAALCFKQIERSRALWPAHEILCEKHPVGCRKRIKILQLDCSRKAKVERRAAHADAWPAHESKDLAREQESVVERACEQAVVQRFSGLPRVDFHGVGTHQHQRNGGSGTAAAIRDRESAKTRFGYVFVKFETEVLLKEGTREIFAKARQFGRRVPVYRFHQSCYAVEHFARLSGSQSCR